jgi:hypothetical protein
VGVTDFGTAPAQVLHQKACVGGTDCKALFRRPQDFHLGPLAIRIFPLGGQQVTVRPQVLLDCSLRTPGASVSDLQPASRLLHSSQ